MQVAGWRTKTSTEQPMPNVQAIDTIFFWLSTLNTNSHVFDFSREEIDLCLGAIDEIKRWLDSYNETRASTKAPFIKRGESLFARRKGGDLSDYALVSSAKEVAMSWLMHAFHTILQVKVKLEEHDLSVCPSSTTFQATLTPGASSNHQVQEDDYVKTNTISPEVIRDLRKIAMRANFTQCIHTCVEMYIYERKTIMQRTFQQFNIQKWSRYSAQRIEWGVLESLIEVWIKSVKTCLKYLFASEKQSCEQIFQGLEANLDDICYKVTYQNYAILAFNIVYALCFSNPPPDKIFIILDLYETLYHFLTDMCLVAKSSDPFQPKIDTRLLSVLADKITSSLSMFEMALLYSESAVIFVVSVDPLTRYVMSYLNKLCDYTHALRKLSLPNLPSIDEDDDLSLETEEFKGLTELSHHVIWIIMILVSNLETKAKLCEDGSAGHYFAMKNILYIVQKIEGHPELMEVVGDDYFGKLNQKLDQAKVKYLMLELEKMRDMRYFSVQV